MDHALVASIEKALGWENAAPLGRNFATGSVSDAGICARLLTPSRLLDVLMRRFLAPPQLRCLQDGTDLHPDSFIEVQTTRRGQVLSLVNMNRLGRLMQSGCTLVLDALDMFDPTMEVACRALQWWSRELVQVNTYLTTGSAAGFPLHWDDHDVIVVQLDGEKTWEVRSPSRIAPMYRDAEPNTTPGEDIVWSGTMRRGDVMHIPRGYWHQATRQERGDGYSLHVTFGFMQRTGVDWLTWLADHSREHELFRHDLDRWGGIDGQAAQELGFHIELSQLLRRFTPDAYLAARTQEQPPHRHVTTRGVFGPPATVVCITDFPPYAERDSDTITVVAAGKRLTFAVRAEPALRLLLSGLPVSIEEISAATAVDAMVLAEALMREGICAELTDELSSGYTDLVTDASNLNRR